MLPRRASLSVGTATASGTASGNGTGRPPNHLKALQLPLIPSTQAPLSPRMQQTQTQTDYRMRTLIPLSLVMALLLLSADVTLRSVSSIGTVSQPTHSRHLRSWSPDSTLNNIVTDSGRNTAPLRWHAVARSPVRFAGAKPAGPASAQPPLQPPPQPPLEPDHNDDSLDFIGSDDLEEEPVAPITPDSDLSVPEEEQEQDNSDQQTEAAWPEPPSPPTETSNNQLPISQRMSSSMNVNMNNNNKQKQKDYMEDDEIYFVSESENEAKEQPLPLAPGSRPEKRAQGAGARARSAKVPRQDHDI